MENPDYAQWLGRRQTLSSRLDEEHAARIALTLDAPAPRVGQPLPALWHWAFFLDSVPSSELGGDGHPPTGGFLPPLGDGESGGMARMWAGGRLSFLRPLAVGVPATRTSTVTGIQSKQGRQGPLVFVTVLHEYQQSGEIAVREEQDIVYRNIAPLDTSAARADEAGGGPKPAERESSFEASPALLFRYSAVTFNSHRIHYDQPYATGREHYPALVVHGPLIATRLIHFFQEQWPDRIVTQFRFRGLRPLFVARPMRLAGAIEAPGQARLWVEQNGHEAHQAWVDFE